MIKLLGRIVVLGTQMLYSSIHKTLMEELEMSRKAALLRYQERHALEMDRRECSLSLEEAMKILDMNKLDADIARKKFEILFDVNSRSKGNSFYIQSKIFCAKQRIDWEMRKLLAKNTF